MLMTFMVLLVTGSTFAQTSPSSTNIIGKSFLPKTDIAVTGYDPLIDVNIKGARFLLKKGTKFTISDVKESGYIIMIWKYVDKVDKASFYSTLVKGKGLPVTLNKELKVADTTFSITKDKLGISPGTSLPGVNQLAFINSWANEMQFFITLKDFNDKCEPIYPKQFSFTWGFLTLPIKARLGVNKAAFTFEEKINFGISFGGKWQHASTTYQASNLLGGISVANVKVDNDISASALSFSGGYMFQYDKFQVGAFLGLDYIAESPKVSWAYQGKPWVGFAIGLSLFGETKTAASTTQTQ